VLGGQAGSGRSVVAGTLVQVPSAFDGDVECDPGPAVTRSSRIRRKPSAGLRLAAALAAVGLALAGCAPSPPSLALIGSRPSLSAGPPPVVDAHDGSVVQDGGTFWLFGTAYDCGFALRTVGTQWCGIRSFSSTDFVHWSTQGYAIAPSALWQQRCAPPRFGCFRPHVARSPATGQWVLWLNTYDSPVGYRVLVASSPAGPWLETAPPSLAAGGASLFSRGDEDVFVDSAGRGWIAYTVIDGSGPVDVAVERLTSELTSGTGEMRLVGLRSVEAPSLFERDGDFFLTYSDPACPYCSGTGTGVAVAASPLGPWVVAPRLSTTSCDGQPAGVTRLRLGDDPIWLYVSDRWDKGRPNQAAARTWWEPLAFDGRGMPMAPRCRA
jgi:hypothetical protein